MNVADEVKMLALSQVLLYFDLFNAYLWNLYFCNSFLYAMKPVISGVKWVYPLLLDSRIQIRKEFRNTIIVLRNYRALVCLNRSDLNFPVWFVIPVSWVRYIFFKNNHFYLSNVKFCCRHNIIHESDWPDCTLHQPMSIVLIDNVRLFPSLFHFGVSKCRVKCFKLLELGGCFEEPDLLHSFHMKSYPFICGYLDFVYACCNYGFNANENELSSEVKIILSHFYLSKIVQSIFVCDYCFDYFDSFMKFMMYVAVHAPASSIHGDCIESKIKKAVTYHNVYKPCSNLRVKHCYGENTSVNPFVSILADHNHIEVLHANADNVTINNFNYRVSWNVSSYP